MKGYGQFCPVAKATEVLGEKWTPLIIRELLSDDQSFNNLRKGVPLMSPSLLSSRLKSLEVAGVVERQKTDRGVNRRATRCMGTAMGAQRHEQEGSRSLVADVGHAPAHRYLALHE
jgi:hypothetical protein